MPVALPSLWQEAMGAVAGCRALLAGHPGALGHFNLTLHGLAGAAFAALVAQTGLVALIFMVPGDTEVSGWAPLLGLWGATLLREAAAYGLVLRWGRGNLYLAYGVPAFWVAALQPVVLVAMVLAAFVVTRITGIPREAAGILLLAIAGAVVVGSTVIAIRTLSRFVGLDSGSIVLVIVVQALTVPVSFLGFGFLLQLAGYSTATR